VGSVIITTDSIVQILMHNH